MKRAAHGASLFAAAALLALAASGCRNAPPAPRVIAVFGTIIQVDVADPEYPGMDQSLDRLEAYFHYLDRHWRSFGPGELGQLNEALGHGAPADLSPELQRLVQRSLELSGQSGGLFDPRVGTLVKMWGFQDPASAAPVHAPSADAVAAARATNIVRAVIHVHGRRIWSDAPVTLDLGSIGKGSALMGAAAMLRSAGIENALINAGGDLIALGAHGGRPWRIGVRDPRSDGLLGTLNLGPGETVSSSGDYERFYTEGPRRYHHIIDPRTGYPSEGTAGTTVLGRDAELAHAASTALMVAGREGFDALVMRLGVESALLVTSDGQLLMTPGMRKRITRIPGKV